MERLVARIATRLRRKRPQEEERGSSSVKIKKERARSSCLLF